MGTKKNLTGKKFGRLTVLYESENRFYGNVCWVCKCECGTKKSIMGRNLVKGYSKSCGCLNKEIVAKHRKSNTSEYHSWNGMKGRCDNPNNKGYKNYGGRGITYDPKWKSFLVFYEDMGPKPSKKHSLDRIDNNGNYCKENCRWTDWNTQENNKRKKDGKGYYKCAQTKKYRASIAKQNKTYRLGRFDTPEEARKIYLEKRKELYGY